MSDADDCLTVTDFNELFDVISIQGSLAEDTWEYTLSTYLCSGEQELKSRRLEDLLESHPLYTNSFALYPPYDHIRVESATDRYEIRNKQGCTIEDILDGLLSL